MSNASIESLKWLSVVALVAIAAGAIASPSMGASPYRTAPVRAAVSCPVHQLVLTGACEVERTTADDPHPGAFSFVEPASLIASVVTPRIVAREAPRSTSDAIAAFPKHSRQGTRQVFLLTARPGEAPAIERPDGTWYEVLLPVRPNGTLGYVRAEAVSLSTTSYRVVVDRGAFRLTLWKGADVVATMPIGLGTGKTPTPSGRFYLISLLQPPEPDTIYGTFAYGLSGYSEVLTDWAGGGVVGLHGTNDPSSIGVRSSHGCIRMHNEDIEKLVPVLPLGTPIEII